VQQGYLGHVFTGAAIMAASSQGLAGRQGLYRYLAASLVFFSVFVCIATSFGLQDSVPSFKMRFQAASLALLPGLAQGVKILQANDDGWAELYVRSFNLALNAAGHDVVLSCPAENRSGSGTSAALVAHPPSHDPVAADRHRLP
jgi:hypothetical protein